MALAGGGDVAARQLLLGLGSSSRRYRGLVRRLHLSGPDPIRVRRPFAAELQAPAVRLLQTAGSHSTLHSAGSHCQLTLPAHTPHCQLTLPAHTSHCQLKLPAHTAGSHSTLPADTAACVRLVLFQLRVRSATGSAAARRRAVADLSKRTRRAATVRLHAPSVCTTPGSAESTADSAMLTGARISKFTSRPGPGF